MTVQAIVLILFGMGLVIAALLLRMRIGSFQSQTPDDYDSTSPRFDLREHLNGPIICEGVIFGPMKRVVSRFVGDFDASWDGSSGTMREVFNYDSGMTQTRQWNMELGRDGSITATAEDVIGTATGQQAGSAVVMHYRIRLSKDAGGHVLDVTDWMYRLENGTIVNRSQFRKFGITVAELCATIRPRSTT